ncbi:hypothetical protein NQU96_11770 [Pseudoalteromonas elyakovii]|nr:hypothetical protein [Pseudoalteromonas elyakovii]
MFYLVKGWNSLKNIFRYFFGIHEDKALHQNWVFWIVVLVPLGVVCWLMYTLTQDLISDGLYNPRVSSESLASFVNYYAFPITMLTVPLTLAVMINRFHSSKQKAKSNRLVELNNAANSYFSHYNYFKKYLDDIDNVDDMMNRNTFKLAISCPLAYRKIFTNSTINTPNFDIPESVVDELVKELSKQVKGFKRHVDQGNLGTYPSDFEIEGFKAIRAINSIGNLISIIETYFHIYDELFKFQGTTNVNEIREYLLLEKESFYMRFIQKVPHPEPGSRTYQYQIRDIN